MKQIMDTGFKNSKRERERHKAFLCHGPGLPWREETSAALLSWSRTDNKAGDEEAVAEAPDKLGDFPLAIPMAGGS